MEHVENLNKILAVQTNFAKLKCHFTDNNYCPLKFIDVD